MALSPSQTKQRTLYTKVWGVFVENCQNLSYNKYGVSLETEIGGHSMSIVVAVYIPEGIILAGDSRLTGNRTFQNNEITINREYTLSDNVQKVMLLSKVPVGIATCGNALIDGRTIADYVRKFEIDEIKAGDTVAQVAEKLCNSTKGKGVYFFVCGYNNDTPYVYEVNDNGYERRNISEGNLYYGALWNGQMQAITKLVNSDPTMPISWGLMTLKDGVDFAEFLVSTTINYERFSDDIQTCGGPIDILVINKDGAFWYKHKIFKP